MNRASALLGVLVLLVLGQLTTAAPAVAHAELVATNPQNGAQLTEAPAEVTLQFTESVGLLGDGIRLLDAEGGPVTTPQPIVNGNTVRWEMPGDLPDGAYLVSWRVVSGDSHPIAGAFSFGVGDGVTVDPVVAGQPATFDAPWPVMAARFGGYVGFTVVAGALAFALVCWKPARDHPRNQTLLRAGFVVALLSTVVALLLQGPYAAGQPLTRLFDQAMIAEGANSLFGAWTQIRVYVLLAMTAVLWPRGALETRMNQWLAGGGVVALAATFSGTSHAAASGDIAERIVDSTHVLTAATWAGGLIAFTWTATARGDKPGAHAFAAFSRIALWAVLVLVATGFSSSLYRLDTIDALWTSDYGRILALKLALVALALAIAAVSRQRRHRDTEPWRTVRFEAATTLVVLAATSVLASVTPPATTNAPDAQPQSGPVTIDMPLAAGNTAEARVDPPTTTGSRVTVTLLDSGGEPLDAARVQVRATLPGEDIGPLDIAVTRDDSGTWEGDFTFPLPGTWTLTLTVEDRQQSAVVTTGDVDIS